MQRVVCSSRLRLVLAVTLVVSCIVGWIVVIVHYGEGSL